MLSQFVLPFARRLQLFLDDDAGGGIEIRIVDFLREPLGVGVANAVPQGRRQPPLDHLR